MYLLLISDLRIVRKMRLTDASCSPWTCSSVMTRTGRTLITDSRDTLRLETRKAVVIARLIVGLSEGFVACYEAKTPPFVRHVVVEASEVTRTNVVRSDLEDLFQLASVCVGAHAGTLRLTFLMILSLLLCRLIS